jgi:hypothetical protein
MKLSDSLFATSDYSKQWNAPWNSIETGLIEIETIINASLKVPLCYPRAAYSFGCWCWFVDKNTADWWLFWEKVINCCWLISQTNRAGTVLLGVVAHYLLSVLVSCISVELAGSHASLSGRWTERDEFSSSNSEFFNEPHKIALFHWYRRKIQDYDPRRS